MKKLHTEQKIAVGAQIYAIIGVLMWLAATWYFGLYPMFIVIALVAIPGTIASTFLTSKQIRAMA